MATSLDKDVVAKGTKESRLQKLIGRSFMEAAREGAFRRGAFWAGLGCRHS